MTAATSESNVSNRAWVQSAGIRLALVAATISGLAIFVNGRAVRRFASPTIFTTGKNLVAGMVLIALAIVVARRRRGRTRPDVRGTHVAGLAAVAVVGGAVPFVLFFEGLARATSSDAAFIHKTLVVWAAVLAVVLLGERLTAVHVAAVAVLVVAQAVVADGVGSLRGGAGEAMILVATLCWSIELIIVKRLVESLDPTVVAAGRIAGGAGLLVGWLVITGRVTDLASFSLSQWAWILLSGLTLSAFVSVWFSALQRAPVVDVAAVLVLGAVVTGVLDLLADGVVVPVRLVGWSLIAVAVAAIAARHVQGGRSALAR